MIRTGNHAESVRDRWLATIRGIAEETLAPYQADIYLFGSYASGTEHHASDVDVAVDPRAPLPVSVLASLRDAFEESTVPLRVDVVDLREVGPAFRQRVLKEGIRWTASKSDPCWQRSAPR